MVTLAFIRETLLSNYHPRSDEQGNVKAVLQLFVESDPQPSNTDCIENLREDLLVEVLYSMEVLKGPTTLYRIIRDYLEFNGLSYHRHPSSPRILCGLVNMFYIEDEDRAYALNNRTHLRASPIVSQNDTPTTVTLSRNPEGSGINSDSKMAHNIASRFKTSDRFTRKLGQDLQFIDNYLDACSDYGLNHEQRLRFLHKIFSEEAKRFYREHVADKIASFGEACAIMGNEFNSISRQNRIRKLLQNLRLESVMRTKNCTVPEALENSPNAKHAAIPPWSFQQLYTALDTAWLQKQRQQSFRRNTQLKPAINDKLTIPGINYDSCSDHDNDHEEIHYRRFNGHEGQRMYGVPRRPGSSSVDPRNHHRRHFRRPNNGRPYHAQNKPRTTGARCFCCGSVSHFLQNCPPFRELTKTVISRFSKNPSNAKQILFELSQQMEEVLEGCNKPQGDFFSETLPPYHSPPPAPSTQPPIAPEPNDEAHQIMINQEQHHLGEPTDNDILDPEDF